MSKKPSPSLAAELKPLVAPFRFDGSGEFHLKSHKADERGGLDKDKAEKILDANRKRLNDFQEKLYAQDRWSLLLIFQGMDAAGKDSAIKSIFDGINPQGCEVTSFKQPSTKELDHDFLWRRRNLNPNHALALAAHFQSLRRVAARELYRDRDFRSRRPQIVDRDRHHVGVRHGLARKSGFHFKIGQPAVAIHPVVKEPLQIALRLSRD